MRAFEEEHLPDRDGNPDNNGQRNMNRYMAGRPPTGPRARAICDDGADATGIEEDASLPFLRDLKVDFMGRLDMMERAGTELARLAQGRVHGRSQRWHALQGLDSIGLERRGAVLKEYHALLQISLDLAAEAPSFARAENAKKDGSGLKWKEGLDLDAGKLQRRALKIWDCVELRPEDAAFLAESGAVEALSRASMKLSSPETAAHQKQKREQHAILPTDTYTEISEVGVELLQSSHVEESAHPFPNGSQLVKKLVTLKGAKRLRIYFDHRTNLGDAKISFHHHPKYLYRPSTQVSQSTFSFFLIFVFLYLYLYLKRH